MGAQDLVRFVCASERRRLAVAEATPPQLNGIDYLEVGNEAQTKLALYFIFNLPGQPDPLPAPPEPVLTADNIRVDGGVRVKNIRITGVVAAKNKLTVTVEAPGDFSSYTLRLVTSPTNDDPPHGFDPQLARIEFSFKAGCASEFDCKTELECPPSAASQPLIDYLAKDYASFRRLMFDRLTAVTPDWKTRNPADLGVALVEMLAYVGDELSYYQDAVATESYLGTARSRVSLRRHARLLDYRMHEGCNARVWLCFEIQPAADGTLLQAGTKALNGDGIPPAVDPAEFEAMRVSKPTVFETMHAVTLRLAHNTIDFYTWSDEQCCLPMGATRATLADKGGVALAVGDFVLFEEVMSPTTGLVADADPGHRQVVRLTEVRATQDPLNQQAVISIAWGEEDALSFPLCVSAVIASDDTTEVLASISVVRANVVLADHGLTRGGEALIPPASPALGSYRPHLPRAELTFATPWNAASSLSARASLYNEARKALPSASLVADGSTWTAVTDLLSSDRFSHEFVVEMENNRVAAIRFGDDVNGRQPAPGMTFTATYRVGNGRSGNVGRDSIGRVVTSVSGIARVRNPLPASGGTDPETLDQVRRFAPQAFRTQERAVTEADYEAVAALHPEVQRAKATFRWTGSWYTVFVTVDRKRGLAVEEDPRFRSSIIAHIERYRLAGYDLEIKGPVFVALDIRLFICVKPGYFNTDVKAGLKQLFTSGVQADGRPGYFHPDNFSFGDPLYLSAVIAAAMTVAGVASVEAKRFQRLNKAPNMELQNGVLRPAPSEIIQLDNDPNFPEHGKIEFVLEGGL